MSRSRSNRPGAVLAVFFALFFAGAPLICLQLCHLRYRNSATAPAALAPVSDASLIAQVAQGHGHAGSAHAAESQPATHSHNDPFLAEMQRLLQSLVEGALVTALVIWPLATRPSRTEPLPALVRAALEVRQPPPRAGFVC